jgi:hypothetical protein
MAQTGALQSLWTARREVASEPPGADPVQRRLIVLEVAQIGVVVAPSAAEQAQVLAIMELRRSVITGEICACTAIMVD